MPWTTALETAYGRCEPGGKPGTQLYIATSSAGWPLTTSGRGDRVCVTLIVAQADPRKNCAMPTVPGPDERICLAQLSLGVMTEGLAKL
jgi:hypothetical protein